MRCEIEWDQHLYFMFDNLASSTLEGFGFAVGMLAAYYWLVVRRRPAQRRH